MVAETAEWSPVSQVPRTRTRLKIRSHLMRCEFALPRGTTTQRNASGVNETLVSAPVRKCKAIIDHKFHDTWFQGIMTNAV